MRLDRVLRVHTTAFGTQGVLLAVLLSTWILQFWMASLAGQNFLAEPRTGPRIVAGLFAGLLVGYTAWFVLVHLRYLTPATGAGFVLPAYGLCLGAFAEIGERVLPSWGRDLDAGGKIFALIDLSRALAVVAYAAGMVLVVAACVSERLLVRRAPPHARPPD